MHPSTLFWLVSSRTDTLVAVLATASMTPDIAGVVCSGLLIFVKSWWQDGCWVHKYGFTGVFVICVYCILRYCMQYVQYLLYSFYGLLSCQCICQHSILLFEMSTASGRTKIQHSVKPLPDTSFTSREKLNGGHFQEFKVSDLSTGTRDHL